MKNKKSAGVGVGGGYDFRMKNADCTICEPERKAAVNYIKKSPWRRFFYLSYLF
jgi:hypothetical protein